MTMPGQRFVHASLVQTWPERVEPLRAVNSTGLTVAPGVSPHGVVADVAGAAVAVIGAEVAGEVAPERPRRAIGREDPRVLDLVLRAGRRQVRLVGRVEAVDVLEALVDLAVVAGLAGGVERMRGGRRCGDQRDGDESGEPPLPKAHERERTAEPESGAPVACRA